MSARGFLPAAIAAALALTAPSARAADGVALSTRTPEFAAGLPEGWSPRAEANALLFAGPSDENRIRSSIVVRYYPPGADGFADADAYVKRQSSPSIFDAADAKPAVVSPAEAAGRKARRIVKELTKTADPGKMNSREIPSREELLVVEGKRGFYVLSYAAPVSLFGRNRPAFVAVLKAFKPLK
jgi:hypothetical protein